MTSLARKLRLADYFALAFGTMVGVGWLVLMDDWLGRGGPLGAILGFALGGIILLPVGSVYGQWVQRLPDAAGEAAYTAQVFPPLVSYFTGWMMLLAYFIVCPWEAVAVGKVAAYIFPSLDSLELYRIAGQPVFLPRLLLGVALTVFLTTLNYRGMRLSANFQNWTTSMVLLLFAIVLGISLTHGSPANFHPAFRATPFVSVLLTLQIVPYFLTGFESVAKCAEEAKPEFQRRSYLHAIALSLLVGALFYSVAIASVAYVAPWQSLLGQRFATAIAYEEALHAHWPVRLILVIAFFGLFQCFNGNFVASSRLLFAFGRNGSVTSGLGHVHERFQTPSAAVLAICAGTLIAQCLGDAILVPVTEVGSVACALGWLATCLSFFLVVARPSSPGVHGYSLDRSAKPLISGSSRRTKLLIIATCGALASFALVLMKFLPIFPGHFSIPEWIALAVWVVLGAVLRVRS
jgi:basic amino acid/polyamine antiporter, APA family